MSLSARRLWPAAAALVIAAGISLWPVTPETPEYVRLAPEPEPEPKSEPEQTLPTPRAPAPPPQTQAPAAESDNLHPHPLTPEHERIQQELRLVGALQDALDLQDVPALRSLVERYRAHVPGDENKLGEGYARLADCLDSDFRDPGGAREAAAAYYENERASTLRRYIRRYCLER